MIDLLDLIWPRTCEVCGRPADRPGRHVCSECINRLAFIPTDGCCRRCGRAAAQLSGEYLCEDCRETKPAFDRAASALSFESDARRLSGFGTVREVMDEGPSKRNAARWSGRDGGNRIVVWDKSGEDTASPGVGDLIRVKITEAHPQILIGQPFGLNEGLIRDYVIDLSEREKWSTEK